MQAHAGSSADSGGGGYCPAAGGRGGKGCVGRESLSHLLCGASLVRWLCVTVCLLPRCQPASQPKFFPASDILGFEISRFYRGDLTGVIRGTIFVQLYKTRHEQVSFKEQNKNSTTGPYFRGTQIGSKKGVWSCNILHHHGQTTDSSYIEYPRWL